MDKVNDKFLCFCNECSWKELTVGLPYEFCPKCEHVNIGFSKIRGDNMWNVLAQKVGIWYKDRWWRDRIFKEIIFNMPEDSIRKIINSTYDKVIQLKDGSTIRMISATESGRGNAVNRSFIQDGISYDVYSTIISPCTKPAHFDSVVVGKFEDFQIGHLADEWYWRDKLKTDE